MPTDVSYLPQTATDLTHPFLENVVGAAIFDLSGLPKDYFTTSMSNDVSWVQTIFQALGLQTLLMSSLKLEGFRYAIIHGAGNQAIIVRQKSCYTAVLLNQSTDAGNQAKLIQHIQELDSAALKHHPQFQSI